MNFPALRKWFFVLVFVVITFDDVTSISTTTITNSGNKVPSLNLSNPRKCGNKIEPIGSNPCTRGPSYWCASIENAKKCGLTRADCTKYGGIKSNPTAPVPIGGNPCTWGPSYWCASVDNAKKCGLTEADCAKYGGITTTTTTTTPAPVLVGGNPCTWGPSYWCASVDNAKKCGLTEADCDKYGGIATTTTTSTTTSAPVLVGGNPCTWGPSYWCASVDNAKKCGLTEADCDKYGGIATTTTTSTTTSAPVLVGGNPCTWGPSYWCASVDNAKKCGLTEADCDKYGGIATTTTTSTTTSAPVLVGGNPCTWGPSYWCASADNAKKCGLTETDCDKYGGIATTTTTTTSTTTSAPVLVGGNPCTWGPSYWCASGDNAKKCGLTEADCDKYGGIATTTTTSTTTSAPVLVGGNPCTWGPSYWCASVDNAKICGLTEADCAKYGGIQNAAAATSS